MHNLPPRHNEYDITITPSSTANQHLNQPRSPDPDAAVDHALGDLALDAVRVLSQAMTLAPQYKDRIAAANSILDRLGYGRATRAQADQADREIRNALEHATKVAIETERAGSMPPLESGRGDDS